MERYELPDRRVALPEWVGTLAVVVGAWALLLVLFMLAGWRPW